MHTHSQSFKLIKGNEIRKLSTIPQNYSELLDILTHLFSSDRFEVFYTDSLQDDHTISNDQDLQLAIQALSPKIKFQIQDRRSLFQHIPEQITCLSNESDQDQIDFIEYLSSDEDSGTLLPSSATELSRSHLEVSKRDYVNISNSKYGDSMKSSNESFLKQSDISQIRSIIQEEFEKSIGNVISSKLESHRIVHYNVKCDGCGNKPILGVRYRCSMCSNFNYCSMCEQDNYHIHPFLKYRLPEGKYRLMKYNSLGKKPNIFQELLEPFESLFCSSKDNMFSEPKSSRYNMLCLDGNNITELTDLPLHSIEKQWLIKNTGKSCWTSGTTLKIIDTGKGDLKIEIVQVPMLKPKEEGYIFMEYILGTPNVTRSFCMVTPGGIEFGKLNLDVTVKSDGLRQNLKTLIDRGINSKQLKECMEFYDGNIELAVLHIMKEL